MLQLYSEYCCSCYDLGIFLCIGKLFPRKCLADKLFTLGRLIAYNPVITLIGVVVVYPILVVFIFPFYIFSFLLTSPGTLLLLIILLVLGLRSFARSVIFPGSLHSVQRNISREYLKGLSTQCDRIASSSSAIALSLINLTHGGRVGLNSTLKLDELELLCKRHLPCILAVLDEGVNFAQVMAEKGGNGVSVEDSLLFKDLHNSGSSLFHSVSELLAMLSPVATSRTGLGRLLEVSQKELVDLCMQCMSFGGSVRSASEMLKQSTGYAMADVASSNNTPSYLASIQSAVSDWFLGPQGIEKMSFPMMRRQIHFSFTPPASTLNEKDCSDLSSRVHRLRINGSQGNIIDGIFICAQSRTTCTAFSNSATVLFCPPNAGFYECFAMSSPNSSWLWFYLQKLDMNVCVFNYRGYGDSSGVPDPSRVKDDGLAVAQHLKETMKVNYLYLHGESIGGMVACHIARHYGAAGIVRHYEASLYTFVSDVDADGTCAVKYVNSL
mmetsp:Transcript_2287/g.3510  ORF Transcript_2287/g.3510 Transcript_2287/m.3510 type:complete len:496 (+) Transcript_2287:127-1614(+)